MPAQDPRKSPTAPPVQHAPANARANENGNGDENGNEPAPAPVRSANAPVHAYAHAYANRIATGYEEYRARFRELTRRAAERFAARDWPGAQQCARNRLLLYGHTVRRTLEAVAELAGDTPSLADGIRAKAAYSAWCAGRPDIGIAQTFFNSVIRRTYGVVGVNPALEYAVDGVDDPPAGAGRAVRTIGLGAGIAAAVRELLAGLPLGAPLAHPGTDAALVARVIEAELAAAGSQADTPGQARPAAPGSMAPPADAAGTPPPGVIEVLHPVFYRNKGAYVVGRVRCGERVLPLVLALLNGERGVYVDAVLPTADEASVVFGFTRSYFQVEVEEPREMVEFLHAIMPTKRVDELYTAIGFNRHGKTELYRALMRHLESGGGRFEPAPGIRGMVMSVFTLPSFNVVFKVIKDRFDSPKRTTRRAVMRKYRFVFMSDRVGRLADAQEFERLELRREWFSTDVLAELLERAGSTVHVEGEHVRIDHLYTERRVVPLDLYIRQATPGAARDAVFDYGRAVRDLAAANIFPGDLLLKNFGVTRHGRVIFYDYDELEHLTTCRFRRIPEPRDDDEALADEAWFPVGEHDVFPEEFPRFLGLPPALRDAFRREHGELFDVDFWLGMQARQRAGELVDFFPYPPERRLHGPAGPAR